MRTVQVTRFGDPEVLEQVNAPEPEPGAGQLLINVEYAEVLFLDTQLRAGWGGEYFTVEPPYIPGVGITGTVAAVGSEVDDEWAGRRVIASTSGSGTYTGGGYAERAVADASGAHVIPDGLDARVALAALSDGVMAVSRIDKAGLSAGDTALVTAAGGAIGTWLIPLLKHDGVRVIAVARGEQKLSVATERGADVAVDYGKHTWIDGLDQVDAVFDGTGGDVGTAAASLARPGGKVFTYGSAAGEFATVPEGVVEIAIHDDFPADDKFAACETALRLLADGVIEPVIGQVVPLEKAADAHAAIAARTVAGKTLLAP